MPLFIQPPVPWYLATSALMAAQNSGAIALAANTSFIHDVYLPAPAVAVSATIAKGAVAAGNLDLGIFDANGNRLTHTGVTVASGANGVQNINFPSPLILPAGRYYLALWVDNATDTFFTVAVGSNALSPAYGLILQGNATNAGGLLASFNAMTGTSPVSRAIPFLVHLQGTGF